MKRYVVMYVGNDADKALILNKEDIGILLNSPGEKENDIEFIKALDDLTNSGAEYINKDYIKNRVLLYIEE